MLSASLNKTLLPSLTIMLSCHISNLVFKGELFWKTDPVEAPFSPTSLPESSESSRMLYLWLTPYMANTLGYVALQHGILKYNLTAKDVSMRGFKYYNNNKNKKKSL